MTARTTIVAVASAPGASERAVLRLSGPRASQIASQCCIDTGSDAALRFEGRAAVRVRFDDGVGELPATLLWMPGPRSFTAEDVVELHVPGHPELVEQCLERLHRAGADLAEPGEFTRRAFENGRIDLTQAEGIAALMTARSRTERRAATALLTGGLARRIEAVRGSLESVRALTEASLDFDEADTGHVPFETIEALAAVARGRLADALAWEAQRTRDAASARVVLTGAPNAGKSTLFNRLASGDIVTASGAALVSEHAGTTRDAKRGEWRLAHDQTVELVDTAGRLAVGPGTSVPDALAEARARDLVAGADLLLWVVDATRGGGGELDMPLPARSDRDRVLLAWNKADDGRARAAPPGTLVERASRWIRVSGASGLGLDALTDAAREGLASDGGDTSSSGAAALGVRHREALRRGAERVDAAIAAAHGGAPLDLVAEDLRIATDELDAIDGRTTPEDLLDRIFAQFCLGK